MEQVHRNVMVETYRDPKKPYPRVRPCPGQGLNDWNIRFPRELRSEFQVGQKFYCDLRDGPNQYILVGEVQLIQTITFNHGGKKVKEEITPTISKPTSSVVEDQSKVLETPKLGQRKIKF